MTTEGSIEHVAVDRCPTCHADTSTVELHEPALVRHAGYGGTRHTTTTCCTRCDWSLVTATGETRP